MLSGPAWPNRNNSGLNFCFPNVSLNRFAKHPSYARNLHRCCILIKLSLNCYRGLNTGSFLIIALNLSRHIDGDVRNLRKFEYLYYYFRYSRNAWKYDLTSGLTFFRPVMKVKYINNCGEIFDFKWMGLFLICQRKWALRDRAVWFAERGHLLLNAWAVFCLLLFFFGI